MVDQLAHHFPAAGELLSGSLEVVRHARVVAELEVREPITALLGQCLRIQDQGMGAFTGKRRPDDAAVELFLLPHRRHGVAHMVEAGHPADVDRLLGELPQVDIFQRHLDAAVVTDRQQGRAMTAGFLPAERLGAARIGDRLRRPGVVIMAEQRVTEAGLLDLGGQDGLVRGYILRHLAHIGSVEQQEVRALLASGEIAQWRLRHVGAHEARGPDVDIGIAVWSQLFVCRDRDIFGPA